jgi:hypothetical protein
MGLVACAPVNGDPGKAAANVAPPIRNTGNTGMIGSAAAGGPSGWQRFSSNAPARIQCGELPIVLEGNHTNLTLSGNCGYVRVAGNHNDIAIELAPGGTIEITGAHNDVSWTQPNAAIPATFYNRGESNTFHPEPRT